MEYKEFVEVLRQKLSSESGIDGERIRFEEKGGRFAEAGDRLLVEFADHEESTEICALYTEELYGFYQEGTQIEELVEEIIRDIENAKNSQVYRNAKDMTNYEKIKENLFIRLLNEENNRELLKDAIYRLIGDIALVVYARMAESEKGLCSALVPGKFMELWGRSRDEVFREALLNTYFISPPRIYRWEGLAFEPDYSGEDFMDLADGSEIPKTSLGNCLSTSTKINGAVAVFLPGVAERLYELLDSDFYIAFTSIHEAMIHDVHTAQEDELERVLAHIAQDVTSKEEFLSAKVYRYYHEDRRFACVSENAWQFSKW